MAVASLPGDGLLPRAAGTCRCGAEGWGAERCTGVAATAGEGAGAAGLEEGACAAGFAVTTAVEAAACVAALPAGAAGAPATRVAAGLLTRQYSAPEPSELKRAVHWRALLKSSPGRGRRPGKATARFGFLRLACSSDNSWEPFSVRATTFLS